jgi:hypothetical protein
MGSANALGASHYAQAKFARYPATLVCHRYDRVNLRSPSVRTKSTDNSAVSRDNELVTSRAAASSTCRLTAMVRADINLGESLGDSEGRMLQ